MSSLFTGPWPRKISIAWHRISPVHFLQIRCISLEFPFQVEVGYIEETASAFFVLRGFMRGSPETRRKLSGMQLTVSWITPSCGQFGPHTITKALSDFRDRMQADCSLFMNECSKHIKAS